MFEGRHLSLSMITKRLCNGENMELTYEYPPVTDELLREAVRRIVKAGNPIKIVLFGSRARGDARPKSDLDLLVIEESVLPRFKRSPPYYRALVEVFPSIDLVVWTPEEVASWANVRNFFVTTALRQGKILYER